MFFFFNDTATTEIYTLSLHDALPICSGLRECHQGVIKRGTLNNTPVSTHSYLSLIGASVGRDRKSTRLNSSHQIISYPVFCLKKKTLPLLPLYHQTPTT